jgi:hypothetical protein
MIAGYLIDDSSDEKFVGRAEELDGKIDEMICETVARLFDSGTYVTELWEIAIDRLFGVSFETIMDNDPSLDILNGSLTGVLTEFVDDFEVDEWKKAEFWYRPIHMMIDVHSVSVYGKLDTIHRLVYDQRFFNAFRCFWNRSTKQTHFLDWLMSGKPPSAWKFVSQNVNIAREQYQNRSAKPMFNQLIKSVQKEEGEQFHHSVNHIIVASAQRAMVFNKMFVAARGIVKKRGLKCAVCGEDFGRNDRIFLGDCKAFHLDCVLRETIEFISDELAVAEEEVVKFDFTYVRKDYLGKKLSGHFQSCFEDVPFALQFNQLFWLNIDEGNLLAEFVKKQM